MLHLLFVLASLAFIGISYILCRLTPRTLAMTLFFFFAIMVNDKHGILSLSNGVSDGQELFATLFIFIYIILAIVAILLDIKHFSKARDGFTK